MAADNLIIFPDMIIICVICPVIRLIKLLVRSILTWEFGCRPLEKTNTCFWAELYEFFSAFSTTLIYFI